MTWDDLDSELAAAPGTFCAYVGGLDCPPVYTRLPDTTHYAASTMKVAVLAALYRAGAAGTIDLDAPVPVRNEFASARSGAPVFGCAQEYDNDDAVWDRVGGDASLRWLAHRMIVRSSNLATNLVMSHVGLPAIAEVWSLAGARNSVTGRGIEDFAARDAGITNLVTAADLAALVGAIARGAEPADEAPPAGEGQSAGGTAVASPADCAAMLDVLFQQEHCLDLPAGLPAGTRIAHKNGWVQGVRHGAGVVFPDDAPPFAVVVCSTTELATGATDDVPDEACRVIARVSGTAWAARHALRPSRISSTGSPSLPA